jgi:hypothetical protein
MFLQHIVKTSDAEKKKSFVLGDFNMNCFFYNDDYKVKNFYDKIFETGSIPLINRPTRVTINSATLIDNIITTDICNKNIQRGIIKTDISDHFPIFLILNSNLEKNNNTPIVVKKRIFKKKKNLEQFKDQLSLLHWNHIDFNDNANNIYETFYKTLFSVYDANFPIVEKIIKINKSSKSPWITKGLKKSSKIKQKLYIKYLKTKTPIAKKHIKTTNIYLKKYVKV